MNDRYHDTAKHVCSQFVPDPSEGLRVSDEIQRDLLRRMVVQSIQNLDVEQTVGLSDYIGLFNPGTFDTAIKAGAWS